MADRELEFIAEFCFVFFKIMLPIECIYGMSHLIAGTISQQTLPVNYNCYIQSDHEKFTSVLCYPHTKQRHNIDLHSFH